MRSNDCLSEAQPSIAAWHLRLYVNLKILRSQQMLETKGESCVEKAPAA